MRRCFRWICWATGNFPPGDQDLRSFLPFLPRRWRIRASHGDQGRSRSKAGAGAGPASDGARLYSSAEEIARQLRACLRRLLITSPAYRRACAYLLDAKPRGSVFRPPWTRAFVLQDPFWRRRKYQNPFNCPTSPNPFPLLLPPPLPFPMPRHEILAPPRPHTDHGTQQQLTAGGAPIRYHRGNPTSSHRDSNSWTVAT
jgi:hypothetical protein